MSYKAKLFKAIIFIVFMCITFNLRYIPLHAADTPLDYKWNSMSVKFGIKYLNNTYLAFGPHGNYYISKDGNSWSTRSFDVSSGYSVVEAIWNGKEIVVMLHWSYEGVSHIIFAKSVDGYTWEYIKESYVVSNNSKTLINEYVTGLCFDGSQYIIVSENRANYDMSLKNDFSENAILASKDLVNWKVINRFTTDFGKVIFTGDKFIAIATKNLNQEMPSHQGQIYTSKNGQDWKLEEKFDQVRLANIYMDKNKPVITAYKTESLYTRFFTQIEESSDGVWHASQFNNQEVSFLLWDGNQYIGVEWATNNIVTSKDGSKWDKVYTAQSSIYTSIYAGGKYIFMEGDGGILTSSDLVNWNRLCLFDRDRLQSLIWDGNKFWSVGSFGAITYSSDGIIWDSIKWNNENKLDMEKVNFTSITYGSAGYVSVAFTGQIFNSNDGHTWSKALDLGNNYSFESVAYGKGKYIAVGYDAIDDTYLMYSSTDGVNWSKVHLNFKGSLECVRWCNDRFLVGTYRTGKILSSFDGSNWKVYSINDTNSMTQDFEYMNGVYVATSYLGPIYVSSDCTHWNTITMDNDIYGLKITTDGRNFTIVGNKVINSKNAVWKTFIATSTDGKTWRKRILNNASVYFDIAFGNNKYVAAGDDSILWTEKAIPDFQMFYDNTQFGQNENAKPIEYTSIPYIISLKDNSIGAEEYDWYIWNDGQGWVHFSNEQNPQCTLWREGASIKLVLNKNPELYKIRSFSAVKKPISVVLNGNFLRFNTYPINENGTVLVPFRTILEALNAKVAWDASTKTVTAQKDETQVTLTIGSTEAIVNGKTIRLTQAVKTINGFTMIPVRFISENLGAEVEWDSKNNNVIINTIQQ